MNRTSEIKLNLNIWSCDCYNLYLSSWRVHCFLMHDCAWHNCNSPSLVVFLFQCFCYQSYVQPRTKSELTETLAITLLDYCNIMLLCEIQCFAKFVTDCTDNIFSYIGKDFTVRPLNARPFIGISLYWRSLISGFCPIHFTVTLAGTSLYREYHHIGFPLW